MASAVVNKVSISHESFLPSYGWLSPRLSFSHDDADDHHKPAPATAMVPQSPDKADPEVSSEKDFIDFEFRLDDPVAMLPADELFADGKLVPLHISAAARPVDEKEVAVVAGILSPEPVKSRRAAEIFGSDPYVFSPKAPRCTSRWREILGLKKAQSPKTDLEKSSSLSSLPAITPASKSPNTRYLKHLLHRNARSAAIESSLNLPLLRDSDSESVSISSRLSLSSSSSSSGQEHEDLPRLSLDFDKPSTVPLSRSRNPPRVRLVQPRPDPASVSRIGRSPVRLQAEATAPQPPRGLSVDSPRMNSSGKVVFQSLERSSSSPGSFNGGPRPRPRGMERSYSANVRVLNVPVCSLRGSAKSASVFGFGQLFSPQKKGRENPAGSHAASARIPSKIKSEKAPPTSNSTRH
ncbi:uncharacterized protein [Typha latifolia]|uniref:uncharacterized protein n=1 Tax=Typha latifolia TaxID=4733 RepID=UPI003C2AE9B3